MLKKILIGVVVVIALVVVIGVLLPRTAHVERSITIDSPPATVFTLVNGFERFNEWSPWADMDPEATYAYEGPATGVGAKMAWSSEDPNVGSGSQEIIVSEPYRRVDTKLDFGEQGVATASFVVEAAEAGSAVTWGFETDFGWNLIGRYMGALLFDRMLGPDYERGLASLKALAEGLPGADWSGLSVERVEVEPVTVAYVIGTSATGPDAIGAALHGSYGELVEWMGRNRVGQAGPPRAIATSWSEDAWDYEACIPFDGMPRRAPKEGDSVQVAATYSGPALRVAHVGAYAGLADTWEKLDAYLKVHGIPAGERPWEEFVSDPGTTPEAEVVTHLYWPVAE